MSDSFIWFYGLTEINGRIEEAHNEEMASANATLVLCMIDISGLMEASQPFLSLF